jgi:hypothetical protein
VDRATTPDAKETKEETGGGVQLPPGYLDPCLGDADCAEYGLKCFSEGPTDVDAVCSIPCTTGADCPESMVCKKKGEVLACLLAQYCDTCTGDSQCGEQSVCIEDKTAALFCSPKCTKDDPASCMAGSYCKKVGLGLEDYRCFPLFGACKGDGTHCTPCQYDSDCNKGHQCHENAYTHEKYCAKTCMTKGDCPKGFGCYEVSGEKDQLCTLEVDAEPVETCYKGNKEFCEPCFKDYECGSGVCYNYAVENKYFCTFACDKGQWPGEGCPPGLFCAPNHGANPDVPQVCVPPTAWGCQGFLNCLGVECQKGEKCVDGFCQPK